MNINFLNFMLYLKIVLDYLKHHLGLVFFIVKHGSRIRILRRILKDGRILLFFFTFLSFDTLKYCILQGAN